MFGTRKWLILGILACAALFVAGGMWSSRAKADRPAPDRAVAAERPAAMPTPASTDPAPTPAPVALASAAPASAAPASAASAEPAGYQVLSVLDIPGPMRPGDWKWDDSAAPADGLVVVTADLKAQTLSVFRGGHEIGAAVILYGADDKPTPTGIFPITQKKVHHVSNLYDAKMPYMQRLTNDGVALHASEVKANLATHGCLGLPLEFAKRLYGVTQLGTKVIITDGEMLRAGGAITAVR